MGKVERRVLARIQKRKEEVKKEDESVHVKGDYVVQGMERRHYFPVISKSCSRRSWDKREGKSDNGGTTISLVLPPAGSRPIIAGLVYLNHIGMASRLDSPLLFRGRLGIKSLRNSGELIVLRRDCSASYCERGTGGRESGLSIALVTVLPLNAATAWPVFRHH